MTSLVRPPRTAARPLRGLAARAPFECAVLVLALVYVALHLSGSSYAIALRQLGSDDGTLVGQARAIRTDEWSVTTPLFQIAVNNDFKERNETSFYRETLRSHIGLPLRNWAIPFKPLVLPFFVTSPALAYSFYWAANAALMLVGWSLLLRCFGFSRLIAGSTAVLLYFSPFVQAWSGPAPHLSLFPWVVLALVGISNRVWMAIALALLIPTWLISMFFVSGVAPLFFLAFALCLAFKPGVFSLRRLPAVLAGAWVGVVTTLAYFAPVLSAYSESVYPGNRWARGGEMSLWHVASQLLPATTTEGFSPLIAANISEAATVATWLPVLVLCLVDYRKVRARLGNRDEVLISDLRRIVVVLTLLMVISLWQLMPVAPLSYVFGFGLSPGGRTLFASGALLLVAAAYAIDRLPLRLTAGRLTVFTGVVLVAWLVASLRLHEGGELGFRDELLVLPVVIAVAAFTVAVPNRTPKTTLHAALTIVTIPLVATWGWFNPLQDTRPIFEKPDTAVTRELDELAATRRDGAIAVRHIPDAVLNGVGYRSVTHVIATPSPELFRPYFPDMDEERFDVVFNRFMHVSLTDRSRPFVAGIDVVRIPYRRMAQFAATLERERPPNFQPSRS